MYAYRIDHNKCTSTNSAVSLNGEFSKRRLLPGELARMNPKSIWIMWPSESSRMFPLCLRKHIRQKCAKVKTRGWLPVLHLNEVTDEAVSGTALDKVFLCIKEPL